VLALIQEGSGSLGRSQQRTHRSSPMPGLSMVPSILHHDPGIASRPRLQQSLDAWWSAAGRRADNGTLEGDFADVADMAFWSEVDSAEALLGETIGDPASGALAAAVRAGSVEEVRHLLSRRTSRTASSAATALHEALRVAAGVGMVRLLAAASGREMNGQWPQPAVVTWASCAICGWPGSTSCKVELLDAMLDCGASVNATTREGETALHAITKRLGAAAGNLRGTQGLHIIWHQLVSRGADSRIANCNGMTALDGVPRSLCVGLSSKRGGNYGARRRCVTTNTDSSSLGWRSSSCSATSRGSRLNTRSCSSTCSATSKGSQLNTRSF